MFTHLKKFTIILALQKNFFIHSSVLHASHSSTVMKRSERSSGHRFSGEVAGHSSKLHIPPAADQVPSNTWKKNLFGLFKGTCYAIIAIVQLKVESEGCLCLIPCCWSPLKRDVFFMCNVRIWSWTCQKHEKKTAPRHNCQSTWAHFLRIRLSHHFTYFKKSLDSTCCHLGLHRPASRHGQGTQPRVKSPPLERLKWCFMLCV